MTPAPDTVLLVEDAPDLGPLLRETVEEWNLRALLARTGAEALEVLAGEPVALILLDHELPDMTGPELLEKLRFQRRAIPPVVLMGASLRGDSEAAGREVVEVASPSSCPSSRRSSRVASLAVDGTPTPVRRRPVSDAAQHRCCRVIV